MVDAKDQRATTSIATNVAIEQRREAFAQLKRAFARRRATSARRHVASARRHVEIAQRHVAIAPPGFVSGRSSIAVECLTLLIARRFLTSARW